MVNPPIRAINRNITDHFLVNIIQNDGVKIVADRYSKGLLHLPAISDNPSMMLSHPQHAKWWVLLALKLQFNYHSVDNRILIFLYQTIDSVPTCISPSLATTRKNSLTIPPRSGSYPMKQGSLNVNIIRGDGANHASFTKFYDNLFTILTY
jgi:hypothetical protein